MKRKYALGGPTNPKLEIPSTIIPKPVSQPPQPAPINTNLWTGGGKSKSKERFREHSLGGDLLQVGLSFIPGVGPAIAPIAGMIDKKIEQSNIPVPTQPLNMNTDPYGQFGKGGSIHINHAEGGILNDEFKQYQTGSHASLS